MNWETINGALRDQLKNPSVQIEPENLAGLWRQTDIEVLLSRPDGLEFGFWSSRHLRSAVFDHLYRLHGENGPLSVLRRSGVKARGNELPPPILFSVSEHTLGIKLDLTLFGTAAIFRDVLLEAIAVTVGAGVRNSETGSVRAKPQLLDLRWRQRNRMATPPKVPSLWLEPITPLRTGNKAASPVPGATLMNSLLARQVALARWMGFDVIVEDLSLFERARDVKFSVIDSRPVDGYRLHPDAAIERKRHRFGHMNLYRLDNVSADVWPHLWLGQFCAAGSDIGTGFGRYKLLNG
jgi:hypothetical protein